MNLYESVFVFSGNLTEKLAEEKINHYEEIIKKSGGKTLKKEYWGLRSLAYRIKKNLKGHYFLLNFETKYEAIKEVESKLKIDEESLRFLNLNIKEVTKEPSLIKILAGSVDGEYNYEYRKARRQRPERVKLVLEDGRSWRNKDKIPSDIRKELGLTK